MQFLFIQHKETHHAYRYLAFIIEGSIHVLLVTCKNLEFRVAKKFAIAYLQRPLQVRSPAMWCMFYETSTYQGANENIKKRTFYRLNLWRGVNNLRSFSECYRSHGGRNSAVICSDKHGDLVRWKICLQLIAVSLPSTCNFLWPDYEEKCCLTQKCLKWLKLSDLSSDHSLI